MPHFKALLPGVVIALLTFSISQQLSASILVQATIAGSQLGVENRADVFEKTSDFDTGVTAPGIVAGYRNDVYISSANSLYRYRNDGTLLGSFTWPDEGIIYDDVAVGHGNLYAAYRGVSLGITVRDPITFVQSKFITTGIEATGIAAGFDNDIYLSAGNSLYRYRNDGTLLNSFSLSGTDIEYTSITASEVPEPATIAVWSVLGLCGYGSRRKMRKTS